MTIKKTCNTNVSPFENEVEHKAPLRFIIIYHLFHLMCWSTYKLEFYIYKLFLSILLTKKEREDFWEQRE